MRSTTSLDDGAESRFRQTGHEARVAKLIRDDDKEAKGSCNFVSVGQRPSDWVSERVMILSQLSFFLSFLLFLQWVCVCLSVGVILPMRSTSRASQGYRRRLDFVGML